MAIASIVEKQSGSGESHSIPVIVYDDAGGSVTLINALTEAFAETPSDVEGLPKNDQPTIEQVADNVWRITVQYGAATYVGWQDTSRWSINVSAEEWAGNYAPQIARYPGTAYDYKGVVAPNGRPGGVQAAFGANITRTVRHPIASLSASSLRLAAYYAAKGAVHNAAYGAYNAGELAIVQLSVQQVDAANVQYQVGYSYRMNVAGENRGGITGVAYHGHDYVWEVQAFDVDRVNAILGITNQAVYVSRPRPVVDILTPLPSGLAPP